MPRLRRDPDGSGLGRARALMTEAEVPRQEAGREPEGAWDCGSLVRRVWRLQERRAALERVPEGKPLLGAGEPHQAARVWGYTGRGSTSLLLVLCPRSSLGHRLGSPPCRPPRPTSRYHYPPSPCKAGAEGRRGAGAGEEGRSGRAPGAGRRRRPGAGGRVRRLLPASGVPGTHWLSETLDLLRLSFYYYFFKPAGSTPHWTEL